MQSCWLKQEGKSSCILFLSGWGMDPTPFRSISAIDHDLLMVYDYRQVEPEAILKLTEKYGSLHLLAWSMGVWIAGKFFTSVKDRFESATALNGTLTPIDDNCGIPPKAFETMTNDFSTTVLEDFYREIFDQQDQAERFLDNRPIRSPESILAELQILQKKYTELGPGEDIFSHKIVGSRDRIFPARSQVRSWGKDNCISLKLPHFPFYEWSSLDEIIGGGPGTCD